MTSLLECTKATLSIPKTVQQYLPVSIQSSNATLQYNPTIHEFDSIGIHVNRTFWASMILGIF